MRIFIFFVVLAILFVALIFFDMALLTDTGPHKIRTGRLTSPQGPLDAPAPAPQ